MGQIVQTGAKIDLHIHSYASSGKDGKKVKSNTIDNVPVLIDKLNENGVNICAITDHDAFSYSIYEKLKEAESQDNSILKVLPGVEFSVLFETVEKSAVIHVVTIFSDKNEDKVQEIESTLNELKPDKNSAYSENRFLEILRKIDIDTILIPHQKNPLSSESTRKNDANSLGTDQFLKFVYTDYFEAFEFKNRKSEVLNKNFLVSKDLDERVHFVTGTDCHDWNAYPAENSQNILVEDFPFTYAKCLPTFKGLVMAMTDHSRLKMVNSFFNVKRHSIECINLISQNTPLNIPLSKGINAIIGDNSIGKSMLLHAMTKYTKPGISRVKSGYQKYLAENNFKVNTHISDDVIFCFDMQGEVRSKFEEDKLNATDFLKDYFPANIDPRPYRVAVDNEINRMIEYLEKKFLLDTQLAKLKSFDIVITETQAESLTFNTTPLKKSKHQIDNLANISSKIEEILTSLSELSNMQLDRKDQRYIDDVRGQLVSIKEKYEHRSTSFKKENDRIEKIVTILTKASQRHTRTISDKQKRHSAFSDNTNSLKDELIDILQKIRQLEIYEPKIETMPIEPKSNKVFDYEFISKLNIERIDTSYINQKIHAPLKSNQIIDWSTITKAKLQEMLFRNDETVETLAFFKGKIKESIDKDFQLKNTIINDGEDKYAEMSSGLNSKIYFDLLAYEDGRDGVYIIDQPEDNISQSAIRTYLLERFKTMRENRQVIMVTHNPQFIVNLDIDNLIYIFKRDGNLQVQSGALEYVCDEYNVLDIVAQNIDGGLESIRKRWKRYDKGVEL